MRLSPLFLHGHPVAPAGMASVETTGTPKFLGNPNARLHVFFDPGRPSVSDHKRNARVAPAKGKTKAPTTKDFRGSMARLSDWLSTYHEVGCPSPRKTRFRPLVRCCRTGFHPQGSIERFSIHILFIVLLSQASWHNPLNHSCHWHNFSLETHLPSCASWRNHPQSRTRILAVG